MSAVRMAAVVAAALEVASSNVVAREPSLKDVLARAAVYAARFQQQLSGIVAEETYWQHVDDRQSRLLVSQRRELRSDLLLVRPVGADRYVEFRDVFEVDGVSVRDREERLTTLFLDPPPGAARQLERVVQESARYNIGRFTRTMNTALLTASFLLPAYQRRFAFVSRGREGGDIWVIQYREREKPTLIRTPNGDNLPTEGRLWLDASTGAVTRTELIVRQRQFKAVVNVLYALEPALGFLAPSEMREVYEARNEQRVEGHARYGRFRRFQVNVDEHIRAVKQ